MEYTAFAEFYDSLMENAEYKKRAEYALSLFTKYDRKPKLLLDLACGTGSFTSEFIKSGIDTIGVDCSAEMLDIARQKSPSALFLLQSAENLDLYGTVDGAVCFMDSLNHITDYKSFCKAISNVSLFLEPERLFIFDVNTEYKHREVLGNNTFVLETDEVFCTWQNVTDETLKTDVILDFFKNDGSEQYSRYSDYITERAYTSEQILCALEASGFKLEAIYDDLSYNQPQPDSQRLYYIARKVK